VRSVRFVSLHFSSHPDRVPLGILSDLLPLAATFFFSDPLSFSNAHKRLSCDDSECLERLIQAPDVSFLLKPSPLTHPYVAPSVSFIEKARREKRKVLAFGIGGALDFESDELARLIAKLFPLKNFAVLFLPMDFKGITILKFILFYPCS